MKLRKCLKNIGGNDPENRISPHFKILNVY
jgi:hypothetical protein